MLRISKNLILFGIIICALLVVLSILFPEKHERSTENTSSSEATLSEDAAQANSEALTSITDVITGKYIASDPSVIKDGDLYRAYYTCLLPPERTAICQKISTDGVTWKNVPGYKSEHVTLAGETGGWDENLETPFVLKTAAGTYLLYYGGYTDAYNLFKGDGAKIGLATSDNGVDFTKVGPVLSPTSNGYDNDAAYSPSIIFDKKRNEYFMVYASHSYCVDCPVGNRILSARSSDGYIWQKDTNPLVETSGSPTWMRDGVAEPDIIAHNDSYILFLTGLKGEERTIGYATSKQLDNGYTPMKNALITPPRGYDLVLAPSVIFADGHFKIWYLSAKGDHLSVSYTELPDSL